jgi:excisionase family DNA binding protein
VTVGNHDRPSAPLLTYQELAGWLNDSVRHLRRLVCEQRIPYHKVGHFIRFDEAEIADWLVANQHGRPSAPPDH